MGRPPPAGSHRAVSFSLALRHRFPGFALDIAFTAPTPGVVVLFGPSGAGKSSVVAAVAGLLRPDAARIEVAGRLLADSAAGLHVPAERRRVGLVFQDARLFPHLAVSGNLRYGLRRAAPGARIIGFDEVVDVLGLGGLLARRPASLSGGERQRVAIGRALLAQPALLLLDEPLASLDAARKDEILPYLARLKAAWALPVLYVTHAADEVVQLADTLVLLEGGRVVAAGPLGEMSARGDLAWAARDDAGAVIATHVAGHDPARQLSTLAFGAAAIRVPQLAMAPGHAVRLRIPARDVILARDMPGPVSVQNVLPARVRAVTIDTGRHTALVEVLAEGQAILARVTPDAVARLDLVPGAPVVVMFKSTAIEVLAA
ncbi:MAG: molybdenum ABC transporter ATP-binding protein [Rhodospirillales bacterium]|nr:molybdenum ABC transporter ATP-binding protein [Rhodospirillales bacterium]